MSKQCISVRNWWSNSIYVPSCRPIHECDSANLDQQRDLCPLLSATDGIVVDFL
jgi:hypothetical protein